MTSSDDLLAGCDREPIHIPGSIQPYGILLVLEPDGLRIVQAAGDSRELLGAPDPVGRPVGEILGDQPARALATFAASGRRDEHVQRCRTATGRVMDLVARRAGERLVVELEPASRDEAPALQMMAELERASSSFERAAGVQALCERAALEFRRLTGFDRVMVYRFIDDEAGKVVAEDKAPELHSFLNHHFPGSDIPRQARALYVRNLIRVIPDAGYTPAPLEPALPGPPLDMSDCSLRSVSPVHLQYLRNMGVAASASVSIVIEDRLWGLIACHHNTPKTIPYEIRAACRTLAGGLARQIRAREEAETYLDRLRLRGVEDDLLAELARAGDLLDGMVGHFRDMRGMLDADGVAVVCRHEVWSDGIVPPDEACAEIAAFVARTHPLAPFQTRVLGDLYPPARAYAAQASGLTAVTISPDEPFAVLWFRAETVETIRWAGNPHKAVTLTAGETLTPRASFEAWTEEVRGRSRRWTAAELDSAGRFRRAVFELRQARRLRELNGRISSALAEKDLLIDRNEMLMREVNHRVQNSLTLVSSFLTLQRRGASDPVLVTALDEAQRRVMAVSLVHRRLYRGDQVETVSLDRYLAEMREEMVQSMGREWERFLTVDATPTIVPTDKAVSLGLIVTELVINANKYAYDGGRGRIEISLREDRSDLRLSVADEGRGIRDPSPGFGSRMMASLVDQLGGRLDYLDNRPGLRVVLTAPM